MTLSPHSIRHGREIGSMMLVFVIALAYASSSPLIMVFALAYFCFSWVVWRHHLLYVYERCYESGGRMWDKIFDFMIWCLFILEFFTGAAPASGHAMPPLVLFYVPAWPACLERMQLSAFLDVQACAACLQACVSACFGDCSPETWTLSFQLHPPLNDVTVLHYMSRPLSHQKHEPTTEPFRSSPLGIFDLQESSHESGMWLRHHRHEGKADVAT